MNIPNLTKLKQEHKNLNQQNSNSVKTGLELLTPPTEIENALKTIDFEMPKRSQNQRPSVDFGEF